MALTTSPVQCPIICVCLHLFFWVVGTGGRATSACGVNVIEADTNSGSLGIGEKSTPVLQRERFQRQRRTDD